MKKKIMSEEIVNQMPADYVEPMEMSFKEFPASPLQPVGMKTIVSETIDKKT